MLQHTRENRDGRISTSLVQQLKLAYAEDDRGDVGNHSPVVPPVASDTPLEIDRPVFDLDDTGAIADFILREVGL